MWYCKYNVNNKNASVEAYREGQNMGAFDSTRGGSKGT